MTDSGEVTQLLDRWQSGETEAQKRLVLLVYDELRQLVRGYMGRQPAKVWRKTLAERRSAAGDGDAD